MSEKKTEANEIKAESSLAIVDTSNASGILKLDADCLEELFEWLSLKNLRSVRETCKRMKQVVNYHIKLNYPLRFGQFEFLDDTFDDLCRFDDSFIKFYKTIKFGYTPLTNYIIDGLKHILSKVERVVIVDAQLSGTFYDDFLKFCGNLKSLVCIDFSTIGIDSEWMLEQYPTIEHIVLSDPEPFEEHDKLKIFLEENPNIKTLSISSNIYDDWMLESNAKFDKLIIEVLHSPDMNLFCSQLNTLHTNGFYKKLELFMYIQCENHEMNRIATLHALEFLFIENITSGTVFTPLPQLKVFYMHSDRDIDNMNMIVDNMENIEKIHFKFADFESILPFIHRANKLKEIKINSPSDGRFLSEDCIDLVALNNERKKCSGAIKLTIYIGEEVYLATKCAKMRTKFSCIEIKRAESHIFDHESDLKWGLE